MEPEVDLSSFLERQRLEGDEAVPALGQDEEEEDDVDHALARLAPKGSGEPSSSFKGKLQSIEVDDDLATMLREKEEADANRGEHCKPFGCVSYR